MDTQEDLQETIILPVSKPSTNRSPRNSDYSEKSIQLNGSHDSLALHIFSPKSVGSSENGGRDTVMMDDAVQSIPDFLAANPVCAPASDQTDKRLRPSPRWGSGRALETKSKLDMQEPAISGGISSLKESTAVTSVMSAEGVLIEASVVKDKVWMILL